MVTRLASTVLGTMYTIDIIIHLRNNGESTQNDMLNVITTNGRTLHKRLELLRKNDLVTCKTGYSRGSRHISNYWKLTAAGEESARLLERLEVTMGGSIGTERGGLRG